MSPLSKSIVPEMPPPAEYSSLTRRLVFDCNVSPERSRKSYWNKWLRLTQEYVYMYVVEICLCIKRYYNLPNN